MATLCKCAPSKRAPSKGASAKRVAPRKKAPSGQGQSQRAMNLARKATRLATQAANKGAHGCNCGRR